MEPIPASFPTAFLDRYKRLFEPAFYERIVAGISVERHIWFRLNPLVPGWENAFAELESEGLDLKRHDEWSDAACLPADQKSALVASEPVRSGRVYIQGLASQLPVRMLGPSESDRILDLTAAPGSKTLQLAALAPEGDVAAVEIVRKRKFKLQDNLTQHGADHVKVFLQDGSKVWRYRPEHFDAILLDAPCSSEGRFRFDDEDSYRFWSRAKTKEMVRKQRRLMFSAVHALRPGGSLVYSTCSLAPEENESVVHHTLQQFGDCLEVEPIDLDWPERIPAFSSLGSTEFDQRVEQSCRLLPSDRMEGFFVCKLRKTASSNPPVKSQPDSKHTSRSRTDSGRGRSRRR